MSEPEDTAAGMVQVALDQATITNTHTGETQSPAEFLIALQEKERALSWIDEQIREHRDLIKDLKKQREGVLDDLRALVRDGTVHQLSLFPREA